MSRREPTPPRGGAGVARELISFRRAAAVLAAVAVGAGLSSCAGGNALALARKACGDVDRSLSAYRSSQQAPDSTQSEAEQALALSQLRAALQIAANAAGENSQWQALMTTLSESTRVPESDLVHALTAQCAVAEGGGQEPPATAG